MDIKALANSLSAVLGQFTPTNFGSRLFMDRQDLMTPENFLIWFHERFHYLQIVFTPYGHLKWGSYRTVSTDIVNYWFSLANELALQKKIPIREYLLDGTENSIKLASNVWFHDLLNDLYKLIEYGNTTYGKLEIFLGLNAEMISPTISFHDQDYRLRGIDILESFAKFEEAMLSELITGKSIDETINTEKLSPEYYSALHYFVEILGPERLIEFPVVCELSLATPHIPSHYLSDNFYQNTPSWRFVKMVETLKDVKDLPSLNFNNDNSFYEYSNALLKLCGYETLDHIWDAAEEYANESDLSMAKEMKEAIEYKKKHPWMLSYPMCNYDNFMSFEFNRFKPYFTIMDDGVSYNVENIKHEELILENHLQALANQICGHNSKYCLESKKLMCGYSYTGMNTCPNYISGECNGHVDKNTVLPELVLDENSNIKTGCTFELCLNSFGLSIQDISVGFMKPINPEELFKAIKKPKIAEE